MYKFVFYFIICNNIIMVLTEEAKNFGPYEPVWEKYEICRGPKLRNVSTFGIVLYKVNDSFIGFIDLNFTIRAAIDEVKIVVHAVNGNKTNPLWVYKVTDPCKHFAIAGVIESELHTHNCIIEKGVYNSTVNFSSITKKIIGPSFFYGKYVLKALMLSKKGNILCMVLHINFMKTVS